MTSFFIKIKVVVGTLGLNENLKIYLGGGGGGVCRCKDSNRRYPSRGRILYPVPEQGRHTGPCVCTAPLQTSGGRMHFQLKL